VNRILLVTHDATRTGAPVLLYWAAKWFHENGYTVKVVIVKEQGDMLEQFRSSFDCDLLQERWPSRWKKWLRRLDPVRKMQNVESGFKPDIILVNSVAIPAWLKGWKPAAPFVYWGHEMMHTLRQYIEPERLGAFLEGATAVFSDSQAAAADLKQFAGGLFSSNVLGGFSPPVGEADVIEPGQLPGHIKKVFLCAGQPGWRKGTDVFMQLAFQVCNVHQCTDIGFVWVGIPETSQAMKEMRLDCERAGIEANVFPVPPVPNLAGWMRRCDYFGLLSREDPFPLVVLDAGMHSRPVFCFEGTGGAADMIVQTKGGFALPYLDVPRLAETLISLSYEEAAERGSNLFRFVSQHHAYEPVMRVLERSMHASASR
jgi:hypothetical protein